MDRLDPRHLIEAALLCAQQPLSVSELATLCDDAPSEQVLAWLGVLGAEWGNRGLELREVGGAWRFQTRAEVRVRLERLHPEKPPKYSRAVLETLAIVAHRQPVTRGEIEEIRGVAVASQTVKLLEERGWLRTHGHRESAGRPALWVTTPQFLSDFGLSSLAEFTAAGDVAASDGRVQALRQASQLPMALTASASTAPSETSE